jgi:carboxypeptidase family protein
MKPRRIAVAMLWGMLGLAVTARAQDTTVSGAVTDATDAVLPGVTVTALLVETGNTFVAVTDGTGSYRIGAMRPGLYKVTVELSGFTTVTRENVQLLVGQARVLDLKMTLATVSESVTVSGQAPLVDTTGSALGSNVTQAQMAALPVNGRNWMALTMLAPGSRANDIQNSPVGLGTEGGGSAGGLRNEGGYYQLTVDGLNVTQTMAGAYFGSPKYSRDAMAEFQYISGRFDATQGRSIGVLVNAVTKSGTNTPSGSAYGYFRDDSLKAADFVAGRVLPYSNQQVGGTIGGPLVKDKVHLFGYYEREREPTTFIFNSVYPRFNIADLTSKRVEQTAGVRLDWQLSNRTRLLARGNGWKNDLPIDPVIGVLGGGSISGHPSTLDSRQLQNHQLYASLTQMLGGRSVNEVKVGMILTGSDHYRNCCVEAPTVLLGGYTIGGGNSRPLRLNGHTWSVREDFSTVVGSHELKVGGDLVWNHDFYEWNVNRYGLLQANGGPVPGNIQDLFPVWNDPSTWNLAPLSPISVRWQQSVTQFGKYSWVSEVPYVGAWVQDNWTVNRRLTLNLGLRWDMAHNFAANQWEVPGIREKTPQDLNNFGPRSGFAYSLNDHRTVIRGGWGLYFMGPKDQWAHHTPVNAELLRVPSIVNDGRADFAINPFNGRVPTYEESKLIPQDTVGWIASTTVRTPFSYQTSIGFQQQLAETMSVQVDYQWTAGRNEQALFNTNLAYNPATGANYPFSDVSKRPFPGWGIVQQAFSAGKSNYHGLETAFTKQFSQRWQGSVTYTLSKFQDYVPQPFSGRSVVPFPVAPDLGNEWAYAEGDQRHRAVFNGIWDAAHGIQVSGLYHYGSGQRFYTNYGADLRNSGNASLRLRPDGTIVPRTEIGGKPIHRVDLRAMKRFKIYGRATVEGSFEVFNLFNHANYGSYTTAEVSPSFGKPQQNLGAAYQPRSAQFGFRFAF